MRWTARIAVFIATTAFGVSTALLISLAEPIQNGIAPISVSEVLADEMSSSADVLTGIHVIYAGWGLGWDTGEPYLRFVVYNASKNPVSYAGYGPKHSPVHIVTNGDVERIWECQNGTEHFAIPPGEAAELRVDRHEFYSRPQKTDSIAIEFALWESPQGETKYYTSEPFYLPEDFRRSIKPNKTRE